MPTSRVKTNLFLTFEIAAKWQNVGYTRRSYRLISLNQPRNVNLIFINLPKLSFHEMRNPREWEVKSGTI